MTPLMRSDVRRGNYTYSPFCSDVSEHTIVATPPLPKNERGVFAGIRGSPALFMVPSEGDAAGAKGKME